MNGNKYMDLRDFVVAKDPSIAAGEDVVVCGGLLRMRHGTLVNGQAVYQRILDLDKTVVFPNSIVDIRQADIFPDEDVRRALRHQSVSLGVLPANGSVAIYGPHIQLTGTRSGLNVFRLQKVQLEAASQVVVDIPSGAAALINVEGGFWDQSHWSLQLQGVPASRVLLNAYEGTHLTLTNSQLGASLLAPRAVVDMDMMGVSGNIIGRYVNMTRAHTLGQRLVGDEWRNTNGAFFEPDEDGVDEATYSLVWPEENPGEQIELQAQGLGGTRARRRRQREGDGVALEDLPVRAARLGDAGDDVRGSRPWDPRGMGLVRSCGLRRQHFPCARVQEPRLRSPAERRRDGSRPLDPGDRRPTTGRQRERRSREGRSALRAPAHLSPGRRRGREHALAIRGRLVPRP